MHSALERRPKKPPKSMSTDDERKAATKAQTVLSQLGPSQGAAPVAG
jgi:hypothetical protein